MNQDKAGYRLFALVSMIHWTTGTLTTGYMLSFNFNQKKEQGVHPVHIGDRLLYEGTL